MAQLPVIDFEVNGRKYHFDPAEMSALDAKDFRAAVGVSLMEAFAKNAFDIDVLAGCMWLLRRKVERTLTYEDVARSLSYDSLITEVEAAAEDPNNPEI